MGIRPLNLRTARSTLLNISTIKMKVFVALLAICVAYAAAAPQKRLLLDDLAGETAKILVCEGKLTEEACKQCCKDTTWYVSAEEAACELACNILPDHSQFYSSTMRPTGGF